MLRNVRTQVDVISVKPIKTFSWSSGPEVRISTWCLGDYDPVSLVPYYNYLNLRGAEN